MIAACLLIIIMSLYYIAHITMDRLEISFLMFILLTIVESIIEMGLLFALVFVDMVFPFIDKLEEISGSFADKL